MEKVQSTQLKNGLNSYLKKVAGGHHYLVTDRGRPVAKLIPLADEPHDSLSNEEWIMQLVQIGCVEIGDTTALGVLNATSSFKVRLPNGSAASVLLKDRD